MWENMNTSLSAIESAANIHNVCAVALQYINLLQIVLINFWVELMPSYMVQQYICIQKALYSL